MYRIAVVKHLGVLLVVMAVVVGGMRLRRDKNGGARDTEMFGDV